MVKKPVQQPGESDEAFAIRQESFRESNRNRQKKCRDNKQKKSAEQKKELLETVDCLEIIDDRHEKRADSLENKIDRLQKKIASIQDSDLRVMIEQLINELLEDLDEHREDLDEDREQLNRLRKLVRVLDITTLQVAKRKVVEHRANDQESQREVELEELREEFNGLRQTVHKKLKGVVKALHTVTNDVKKIGTTVDENRSDLKYVGESLYDLAKQTANEINEINADLELMPTLGGNQHVVNRNSVEHRTDDQESEREGETEKRS